MNIHPWVHTQMIESRGRELRKRAEAYRLAKHTRRADYGVIQRVTLAAAALFNRTPAPHAVPAAPAREVERIRASHAKPVDKAA